MPIFSRPNIDNDFFRQISGTVITLSGETQIANVSGFSISDGSLFIPIIVTGGTNYDVLTYRDGQIILLPQSGSGGGVYSGASPTTCTVGGIPAGTTIAGCNFSNILECMLVPALPLSSSLSVLSGGVSRQFGDCSVGNLCWCVCKGTNPTANIFLSTNGSGAYNCTLISGGSINANTGGTIGYTYSFSCATPSSGTTCTSVGFNVCGVSTDGCTSVSNTSINWQNKKFVFGNGTLYNSGAISVVLSATTGTLSTTKTLNCNMTLNNQFFYYAYPKAFGIPSFSVNGLPNNAWGNLDIGTLFTITFVNTNGYSNQYYVARSDNKITGTYSIVVS